jgi:tRNA A-37 threonylcarbamoyl transferase component Bud32
MPTAALDRLTEALSNRYRIERELGQGGMATVYLAQDLKHDRKVALKVLKPELAAVLGAERFVVEIKTTASLQHPHILPLFDSGSADGFLYYVMPFIKGETLRDQLNRETQLSVAEAVRIAGDVADALDHAHQQGVIHRDIKPENILLANGRPMVADFGIALAVSAAAGGRMTETGLSLGTPHYMSPEQATAEKEVTARSDIYSLGSVLYEMLTGNPPHTGASAQQIIMKIVTEDAQPVTRVRKAVPPNVAAAVAKSLQKLPADRFESSAAFARALADPGFRGDQTADAAAGPQRVGRGWKLAAATLALVVVGMAALAGWALRRTDGEIRDLGLPPNAPIQMAGQFRTYTVARDGSFIVYLARVGDVTQLWYRSLRGTDTRPIPGTEGAGGTPRLSPDGTRVVFQVAGEMKLAALAGGAVTTIGRAQDPHGGEWLADGRLFFADNDGRLLRWIDPGAGSVRELPITYCVNPQLIGPDRVLCGGGADHFAFVISLDRPDHKVPIRQSKSTPTSGPAVLVGSHFRIIDGRYLVYMSVDGTLMGTRITDLDSLAFGRSVPLVPMVRRNSYSGVGQFDIADNGTLTYVPGINADVGRLVRMTRDGRLMPLPMDAAAYLRFTPSPDGRQLAAVAQGRQHQELTVFDLEGGTRETLDTAFYLGAPAWSPDGSALAYRRSDDPDEEFLLLRRLDSPDRPVTLLSDRPPLALQVSSWLALDSLLVGRLSSQGGAVIVDPTRTPATVDSVGILAFFVSLSPDRRWIAYQIPGVTGVHLQPWPARDRRYLVDADGTEPRWASSTELVYLSQYRAAGVIAASVYRARIDPKARSPVGSRELIVRDPRFADTPGWSTATTPNGELIYLQSPSENLGFYLRVIPGWVGRMKRAVDAANR